MDLFKRRKCNRELRRDVMIARSRGLATYAKRQRNQAFSANARSSRSACRHGRKAGILCSGKLSMVVAGRLGVPFVAAPLQFR